MIDHRDDGTMLVTLTLQQLLDEIEQRVARQFQMLAAQMEQRQQQEAVQREEGLLIGMQSIADYLGVNRGTLYNMERQHPCLQAAIKHVGGKRVADKEELKNAYLTLQ